MTKEWNPNRWESSPSCRHNDGMQSMLHGTTNHHNDHLLDVKNHERLPFSRCLSLLSHVAQLVTPLFTYFALCGLPFFYTRRIASITLYSDSQDHKDEHKHHHTTRQWRSILRTVVRLCYSAMGTGCFTIWWVTCIRSRIRRLLTVSKRGSMDHTTLNIRTIPRDARAYHYDIRCWCLHQRVHHILVHWFDRKVHEYSTSHTFYTIRRSAAHRYCSYPERCQSW